MRKTYEKPFAEIEPFASLLMQETAEPDNSGVADDPWAKQNDDVVDDDDETSMMEEKANVIFSNDYIKKVWD